MWSVCPERSWVVCSEENPLQASPFLRVVLLYKFPWLSPPRQTSGIADISHHQQLQDKLRASPAWPGLAFWWSSVCRLQGFCCLIPRVQPWKWSFPGQYLLLLLWSQQVPAQREALSLPLLPHQRWRLGWIRVSTFWLEKLGAVWAAQPSVCLQKAFPSSGSYLKVFNKTSEFFFPRTQQVCQAQPRSLLFHVGSPGCAHLISILRRHHGGFPQRILPDLTARIAAASWE